MYFLSHQDVEKCCGGGLKWKDFLQKINTAANLGRENKFCLAFKDGMGKWKGVSFQAYILNSVTTNDLQMLVKYIFN